MKEKDLLAVVILLLIVVLGHNVYLNYELLQVKEIAAETLDVASFAELHAIEASGMASEAAESSREAVENSFSKNCRYCP